MSKTKIRIVWNGQGGELDSVTFASNGRDNQVTNELVKMLDGNIVNPGDSIVIEEIES